MINKEIQVLYLPIKKKWFDMIREGTKKEEYRLFKKHWISRFQDKLGNPKEYDWICLRNGYGSDAPEYWLPYQGFKLGTNLEPGWHDLKGDVFPVHFIIPVENGQDGIPF